MSNSHYKQWNDFYNGCILELSSVKDKLHWFNKKSSWNVCEKVAYDLHNTMHDDSGFDVVNKYDLGSQCSFCNWSKHRLMLLVNDNYSSHDTYLYRVTKGEVYNAISNVIGAMLTSYLRKKSAIHLIFEIEKIKVTKQQMLNNHQIIKMQKGN